MYSGGAQGQGGSIKQQTVGTPSGSGAAELMMTLQQERMNNVQILRAFTEGIGDIVRTLKTSEETKGISTQNEIASDTKETQKEIYRLIAGDKRAEIHLKDIESELKELAVAVKVHELTGEKHITIRGADGKGRDITFNELYDNKVKIEQEIATVLAKNAGDLSNYDVKFRKAEADRYLKAGQTIFDIYMKLLEGQLTYEEAATEIIKYGADWKGLTHWISMITGVAKSTGTIMIGAKMGAK